MAISSISPRTPSRVEQRQVHRQQRFADMEARMAVLFQQDDFPALLREQGRRRGAGGAAADDEDVAAQCAERLPARGRSSRVPLAMAAAAAVACVHRHRLTGLPRSAAFAGIDRYSAVLRIVCPANGLPSNWSILPALAACLLESSRPQLVVPPRTPLGLGCEATLAALREGRSGLRPNDFETARLDTWIGRVDGLEDGAGDRAGWRSSTAATTASPSSGCARTGSRTRSRGRASATARSASRS